MVLAAVYFLAYRLGVIDMAKAMGHALATIKGLKEDLIRERTVAWYEREVRRFAAPGVTAAVIAASHGTKMRLGSVRVLAGGLTTVHGPDGPEYGRFSPEQARRTGRRVRDRGAYSVADSPRCPCPGRPRCLRPHR